MNILVIVILATTLSLVNGQNAFRDDSRCGPGYPAPNGQAAAECNPEGAYPCCSPGNWCGFTTDHCDCTECIDYRPYRQDNRCGAGFPADNGEDAECNPDGPYPCCSRWNWCGITADHCDCDDCIDYRPYRQDNRCGAGFPADNGEDAECNPDGPGPCCSRWNWCGLTADYCDCDGCTDYRPAYRDDSRCGAGYEAPNGDVAQCNPNGIYPCCSPYNWCGNTPDHCDCSGCVHYRN